MKPEKELKTMNSKITIYYAIVPSHKNYIEFVYSIESEISIGATVGQIEEKTLNKFGENATLIDVLESYFIKKYAKMFGTLGYEFKDIELRECRLLVPKSEANEE